MVVPPRHLPLLRPKWAPGGRFLEPADDPEDEENFYFPVDISGSSEEEDMDAAPQVAAAAAAATPSDPAPRRGSRARARSRLGIALDAASLAKRLRR